ncbi:hypothetical protein [Noviherbaspirillum saxi]|uniref:Amidohydrolase n=1 Tax=Noviherbaspirillum saxi TaxID=2320863 RepID=A0A3A3FLX6_9BURK|nr:hypothetical protein [Noviherbaspirillum saxi]RJF97182.1 hypothetical protein D3871_00520 [Noviherbaspirillum saxi]
MRIIPCVLLLLLPAFAFGGGANDTVTPGVSQPSGKIIEQGHAVIHGQPQRQAGSGGMKRRHWIAACCALLFGAAAQAEAPLPLFDAHMHYNVEARSVVSPHAVGLAARCGRADRLS